MQQALKQQVTVQHGGLIEILAPELPEGTLAEVIILANLRTKSSSRLASLIGSAPGCFATPEEADAFIRTERHAWE
jgi:hypothetical protein